MISLLIDGLTKVIPITDVICISFGGDYDILLVYRNATLFSVICVTLHRS